MQTMKPTYNIPNRTFYNSRNGRCYQDYTDTNNYLFIINFTTGAEMCFVLRDLKKDKKVLNYIYNKINTIFGNVTEIDIGKISFYEYNLMRTNGIPPISKLCLTTTSQKTMIG